LGFDTQGKQENEEEDSEWGLLHGGVLFFCEG